MDPHAGKLVLNGAPSQYARLLPAPAAQAARVDGRTPAELRAFAVEVAGLVRFYGLDDQPEGDWTDFFVQDHRMLAAALSTAAPPAADDAAGAAARRMAQTEDADARAGLLRGLFTATHGMSRRADAWLRAARSLPGGAARRAERRLAAAITDELAPALRRLHAWHDEARVSGLLAGEAPLERGVLSAEWAPDARSSGRERGRGERRSGVSVDRAERDGGVLQDGTDDAERAAVAAARLAEGFGAAAEALASVRDAAEGLAEAAPDGLQRPQVALLDAFVRLFGLAQDTLNALVPRYREFYYRDVLREPERGPVPDRVQLAFALEQDATSAARIPRGTLFSAGEDPDGVARLYAAENAVTVTAAALARVRMLRVVRGPLLVHYTARAGAPFTPASVPGAAEAMAGRTFAGGLRIVITERPSHDAVVQVLASRVVDGQGAEAAGAALTEAGAWPTFGAAKAGRMGAVETVPAELGLAAASPELRLTGGRRFVALAFRVSPVQALGRLRVLAGATGLSMWDALRAVLQAAFDLDLSTAEGWLPVRGYRAAAEAPPPGQVDASFTLGFELPASAPAVVPLWEGADEAPELPPGDRAAVNPAPGLPTLRVWVRPGPVEVSGPAGTASVHPLPFLEGLRMRAVEVRTRVRGLADVQVANTDGPVDPATPFPVFGGTPAVGSYLELRSEELFGKVPSEIAVTVRWLAPPPNTDGFRGWYRDYTVGLDGTPQRGLFDNGTFRGRWRVVDPGAWRLRGEDDAVPLFRTLHEIPPPLLPHSRHSKDSAHSTRAEKPERSGDAKRSTHAEHASNPAPPACAPSPPAPAGALCPETRFAGLAVARTVPPPAYPPTSTALRLELTDPPYAFGNDLYAVNVLSAVVDEVPDADACAATCEAAWQPLLDASTALAACAAPCSPADPPGSGPCVACVEAVRDALVAAALGALLRAAADEAARERLRRVTELSREKRPAALRALPRGEAGDGPPPAWLAMIQGALSLQGCLDAAGGPTEACLAECGAFLGAAYTQGVEACITACVRPRALRYPNPPWLPQAERVTVDYAAGGLVHPAPERGTGALYHLLPFGGWMPVAGGTEGAPLLALPAEDASLLLGFGGLTEAETLSLLFRMEAHGPARPPVPGAPVAWSALDGDDWQALLPAAIPADGTGGLQNSGIVELRVPAGATGGTRIPGPERWLRAGVEADADGYPWTAALLPHALTAVWQDGGPGTGAQLAQPVPAGTITTAVEELPGIGSIVQPMPSFGGRPPETAATYPARLGERLRHKERAVQPWDYERLVLERFPQLWMARALPARDAAGAAPGSTLVVVVAGAEGSESADAAVPRAPGALLSAVQSFLSHRASPFARVQVVNPVYVRVRVTAEVVFAAGPEGGDIDRLNRELIAYLSPWFYDADRAARQGRYAFEPDVSEFIRTRPYVEALLSLSLAHDPDPAALEWYFLTSADRHVIRDSPFGGDGS